VKVEMVEPMVVVGVRAVVCQPTRAHAKVVLDQETLVEELVIVLVEEAFLLLKVSVM
jgi:hypothetical protein